MSEADSTRRPCGCLPPREMCEQHAQLLPPRERIAYFRKLNARRGSPWRRRK